MTRLSASKLEQALACPASLALPQVRSTNAAASKGTAVHAFLCACNRVGREAALAEVPGEYMAVCEAIDVESLPLGSESFAAEVSFALDIVTGKARELGRDTDRDYSAVSESEIPGTADVVGLSADGSSAYVLDWKTGYGAVTPAARNAQLAFLALAACRTYGCSEATVEIVRLQEHGKPWHDRARLDAFALDEFELRLRGLFAKVKDARRMVLHGETPTVYQGLQCRYCDAMPQCPATKSLVQLMAHDPMDMDRQIRSALTPENAAVAYERFKVAQQILARVGEAIYAFAREYPIALPSGKVLGEVVSSREQVKGAVARDVLKRLWGPEVADAACSFDSSKSAIRDALRGVAKEKGFTLKAVESQTLSEIAAAGGIESKQTRTVREHEPKGE